MTGSCAPHLSVTTQDMITISLNNLIRLIKVERDDPADGPHARYMTASVNNSITGKNENPE